MTLQLDRPHKQPKKHGKQPRRFQRILPFLIILLGIAVVLYPVVGTIWQNQNQQQQAQSYTSRISNNFSTEQRDAAIQAAHQWNIDNAGGPILDPWLARIDESNLQYQEYLEQLNLDEVMARVIIPSISSDLPVFHGTAEETLERGIGHLYGSSLPVGGEGTHAVLTGHTGLSHATLWDNLVNVEMGDAFYVNVAGETLKYEVSDIRVVLPEETDSLTPILGEDLITLITCTPYGVNSHRLLVTGHRVPMDEAEAQEALAQGSMPWQWWMTLAIAMAGLALLFLLLLWWRSVKKRKAEEAQ